MAQAWFRLWTETIEDRKLRRLPPAQRWLWVAVLAAAKRSPVEGSLLVAEGVALTERDLVDIAALPLAQVKAGLRAFREQDMLHDDGGIMKVTNWKKRQFISDDIGARVQAHRARVRNGQRTLPGTLQVVGE